MVGTLAEAARVDREQLPICIQDRAAGGSGQQRGGALETAGDAAASGTAESPLDTGDEPEVTRSQRPPGLATANT